MTKYPEAISALPALPEPLNLNQVYQLLSQYPNARILGVSTESFSGLTCERSYIYQVGEADELEREQTELYAQDHWWWDKYDNILLVSGQVRLVAPIRTDIDVASLHDLASHFNGLPRPYIKDHYPAHTLYSNVENRWYIQGKESNQDIKARLTCMVNNHLLDRGKQYVAKFYTPDIFEVFELISIEECTKLIPDATEE